MSKQLQFDDFLLDTKQPALYQAGVQVEIAAQPLRLLMLLASKPGTVVNHAEIGAYLWGERVVDFPNGLHVCIRQIRVALQDSSTAPRYLQNVPRRGYRFLADVSELTDTRSSASYEPFRAINFCAAIAFALLVVTASAPTAHLRPIDAAISPQQFQSQALDTYRRGRFLLDSGDADAVERSRSFFQNAIELDATFAPAFAAVAETYQFQGKFERARPFARQAVLLDQNLAEAHLRVAAVTAFGDWNWTSAEDSVRTALSLAPDSAEAHHAMATIFSVTGRMDLAIDAMRAAMAIDPASTLLHADYGMYLYYHGDLETARQECAGALLIDPLHYPSKLCLYKVAVQAGDFVKAMQHANDIVARWEPHNPATAPGKLAPTRAGTEAFERWRLEYYRQAENDTAVSPLAYALVFAALGEHGQVLDHLEQSVRSRETMVPFVLADPVFDGVRDDQRFRNVLRTIGVQLSSKRS